MAFEGLTLDDMERGLTLCSHYCAVACGDAVADKNPDIKKSRPLPCRKLLHEVERLKSVISDMEMTANVNRRARVDAHTW